MQHSSNLGNDINIEVSVSHLTQHNNKVLMLCFLSSFLGQIVATEPIFLNWSKFGKIWHEGDVVDCIHVKDKNISCRNNAWPNMTSAEVYTTRKGFIILWLLFMVVILKTLKINRSVVLLMQTTSWSCWSVVFFSPHDKSGWTVDQELCIYCQL